MDYTSRPRSRPRPRRATIVVGRLGSQGIDPVRKPSHQVPSAAASGEATVPHGFAAAPMPTIGYASAAGSAVGAAAGFAVSVVIGAGRLNGATKEGGPEGVLDLYGNYCP